MTDLQVVNRQKNELGKEEIGNAAQDLWPWECALENPELLDWKQGLSNEEIQATLVRQNSGFPSQIKPHLFISGASPARDIGKLVSLGISHVINAAGKSAQLDSQVFQTCNIKLLEFQAHDDDDYPMLDNHLSATREFIAQAKSAGGRCLIHCMAGLNRSGILVASELILSHEMNALEAVKELRKNRGNLALSNKGFQIQLLKLAEKHQLLGPTPGQENSIIKVTAPCTRPRQPRHLSKLEPKTALDRLC